MASLIYIHGFNSSSASHKAQLLKQYFQQQSMSIAFYAPSLSHFPLQAIGQLEDIIQSSQQPVALVGSSLGGYYATWLVEKFGCKAALVNPAVKPYELIKDYQGVNTNTYTGQQYEIGETHMAQLIELEVNSLVQLDKYLLMIETADEVLDYRLAVEKYKGCQQWIIKGGAHEFCAFAEKMPEMLEFLRVTQEKIQ
jgi:uncharacterized protein